MGHDFRKCQLDNEWDMISESVNWTMKNAENFNYYLTNYGK